MAAAALADTPDPSKTHTLFMGADISVGTGKELYPVKDVVGSSWVVEVAGKEKIISSKEGPLNIKITPSLKLTKVSATVGNMKSERGYTEANDPVALQSRALARAASVNVGYQFAASQANAAQDHTAQQASTINNMGGANSAAMAKAGYLTSGPAVPNDVQTYAQSQALLASSQAAASAGSGIEMAGEGNSAGFDAMDVNFEVSSEKALTNPYVVTVTRFHPKEGSAGMVQNLVYSSSNWTYPAPTPPTSTCWRADSLRTSNWSIFSFTSTTRARRSQPPSRRSAFRSPATRPSSTSRWSTWPPTGSRPLPPRP